ncbi:MAG: nuclease-related domain-containing protein [Candidatus Kapabacteria bacterium]|nr:nuclease-related domain-containing protein [Candidatus Kapabacteria bacterium]
METTVENEKLNFDKVWAMFQETDRRFKETDKQFKETDKQFKEIADKFKKTDELLSSKFLETEKQFKELGKQIGGLGNKFGTFNEGLVLPSLYKLFEKKFQCRDFAERYRFNANGSSMEIDLLAISEESCYLIEIKSHFKPDAIEQLQKQIERFRKFKKEYADRKIYGAIIATHYDKDNIRELFNSGIYFISISDDLVDMQIPENFEPRVW